MREDCRHFQSRTYASGEVVRFCTLDLAPEAPWRCPEECPRYSRRVADAGWHRGSLSGTPPLPEKPPSLGPDVARLLDAAEDVVNRAGRRIIADVEAGRSRQGERIWRRLGRRFRRR